MVQELSGKEDPLGQNVNKKDKHVQPNICSHRKRLDPIILSRQLCQVHPRCTIFFLTFGVKSLTLNVTKLSEFFFT